MTPDVPDRCDGGKEKDSPAPCESETMDDSGEVPELVPQNEPEQPVDPTDTPQQETADWLKRWFSH